MQELSFNQIQYVQTWNNYELLQYTSQHSSIKQVKLLGFLNPIWTGELGIHYENKFTKTFRPTDILQIFTKF